MKNKKKNSFLFLFLILLIAGFFGFAGNTMASEKDLVITEIMYDPIKNENGDKVEWIEMYANADKDFSLKSNKQINDFYLCAKKGDSENSCKNYYVSYSLTDTLKIKEGDFLIFTKDPEIFENTYGDLDDTIIIKTSSSFNLLSNEDAFIAYSDDNKLTWLGNIDYDEFFDKKQEGRSLEKIDFKEVNSQSNWQESYKDGGTPGAESSKKPEPKEYNEKVHLNEIFPNPENEDDEFIEIYNSENEKTDLSGWILRDGSKTGKYVIPDGILIGAGEYLAIYKKDYEFALNNSGDESAYLINPNGKEVSKVSYDKANEGISYNFDGKNWRWSKDITPGKENKFNKLPKIEVNIDKKIYQDIYAYFEVKVNDPEKEKIKVTWDFGDGHKSYKEDTKHKYEKKGKYKVKVKIFDGSEEVVKEYKIEVKKFPHREVKIRALCPNPAGDDSENEWILVKNYSDDEVELKGWSVATGSKKLYNHPIYEDIEIKKGKTAKITREDSHFTLNNEKSKVELRYPDGKEAYGMKYDKGDDNTAEEDEVYEKTDEGWHWLKTRTVADDTQTDADLTQTDTKSIVEENFEEFMGGQSVIDNGNNKMNELVNYGVKIKLASYNIGNNPRVLGVSTEKQENPVYQFTEANPTNHYAVKFFKNILEAINYMLNKLISNF